MSIKVRVTVAFLATATALAIAAGLLAPKTATAAAGAPKAAAASVIPRCLTRNLSAGLHGAQTGLSNRGFILTLTNAGSEACTLNGYPGLGIEDAAHNVLPSRTHWGGTYFDRDPGPSRIVLSPGETASADFAFGTGADNRATYLEITPPNDVQRLTVLIPGSPIQIVGGRLFVTAMARHTPYNT
jgi:hypothetical protein